MRPADVSQSGRRRGFTLLSVGPCLLLWLALAGSPDGFPLFPTMGNAGASGVVHVEQPWSPYGVSVNEEGRVQHDLTVEISGLPAVEGKVYRVWATTPTLDEVVLLGSVEAGGTVAGANDWHQLMVVVSREASDRVVSDGDRWSGPIVLRGFSAGARVTPMAQHSLFQQTPM